MVCHFKGDEISGFAFPGQRILREIVWRGLALLRENLWSSIAGHPCSDSVRWERPSGTRCFRTTAGPSCPFPTKPEVLTQSRQAAKQKRRKTENPINGAILRGRD